ncbi:PNK3P-domain-containing protein [Auricularia subglabra TFB-10046 SS5]|nr:PNK3P-domain-containing protein [Auricularia subglabra TFB-10046 SS5]
MSVAKKRAAEDASDGAQGGKRSRSSALIWEKVAPRVTILHGIHLSPPASPKVAAFDLDDTLISTKSKGRFSANAQDWQWWAPAVPTELARLAKEGFHIVIVTNQAGLKSDKKRDEWKRKVELIAAQLEDVPFTVMAATVKDGYRKPMTGMWQHLLSVCGCEIDLTASFFIGDAAGRPRDHSDCDRKFSLNVGIPFQTPEEYFLNAEKAQYQLKGFRPSPDNYIAPEPYDPWPAPDGPQLVVFVGRPKSGKTEFYNQHMKQLGYARIANDLEFAKVGKLLKEGKSVVIDNCNPSKEARKKYIRAAKAANAQVVPFKCPALQENLLPNKILQYMRLSFKILPGKRVLNRSIV